MLSKWLTFSSHSIAKCLFFQIEGRTLACKTFIACWKCGILFDLNAHSRRKLNVELSSLRNQKERLDPSNFAMFISWEVQSAATAWFSSHGVDKEVKGTSSKEGLLVLWDEAWTDSIFGVCFSSIGETGIIGGALAIKCKPMEWTGFYTMTYFLLGMTKGDLWQRR